MKRALLLLLALAIAAGVWFAVWPPTLRLPKAQLHRKDSLWLDSTGTPFTGILFDTNEKGQLCEEIPLRQGKAHGLARGWHPNGQLEVEEPFIAGTSHGIRHRYHPNGKLRSIAHIQHGVLQGLFEEYHDNGQLAARMTMKDGLAEGPAQAWHPDGTLKASVTLHQGEPVPAGPAATEP